MRTLNIRLVLGTLLPQDTKLCQHIGRPEVVAFYSPVGEWLKELKGAKQGDFVWLLNQWADARAMYQWLSEVKRSEWVALFMMEREVVQWDKWGNVTGREAKFFPAMYATQVGSSGRPFPACCVWWHGDLGRKERMAGRVQLRQWTDEEALGVLLGRHRRAEYRTFLESCGQRPMNEGAVSPL